MASAGCGRGGRRPGGQRCAAAPEEPRTGRSGRGAAWWPCRRGQREAGRGLPVGSRGPGGVVRPAGSGPGRRRVLEPPPPLGRTTPGDPGCRQTRDAVVAGLAPGGGGGPPAPQGFGPSRRALALSGFRGLSPAFSPLLFGEAPPEDFPGTRGAAPAARPEPPAAAPDHAERTEGHRSRRGVWEEDAGGPAGSWAFPAACLQPGRTPPGRPLEGIPSGGARL